MSNIVIYSVNIISIQPNLWVTPAHPDNGLKNSSLQVKKEIPSKANYVQVTEKLFNLKEEEYYKTKQKWSIKGTCETFNPQNKV